MGNYPGIEIRVYGSKAAAVGRLVTERGIAETRYFATADQVEFEPVTLPGTQFPPGTSVRTEWRELYYCNLVRLWVGEILEDRAPRAISWTAPAVREIVDACVMAHVERRWVDLPLTPMSDTALDRLVDRFTHHAAFNPVDATFMGLAPRLLPSTGRYRGGRA